MTMTPYIFLSQNYLKMAQDINGDPINALSLSENVPYTLTLFFADRYGQMTTRAVDTLILTDTNIINMSVEYADGGGVYQPLLSVAGNAESTILVKAASAVNTNSLRITIPNDGQNPASVTAKMGAYGFICNLFALTDSTYEISANAGGYRLFSGEYIHYADFKKWTSKLKINNLTQEQFDAITAQADTGEMTLIPYQDLQASEIYECAVSREYEYTLNRKTQLFSLDLEFNEL